ncbi:MAG: hypothetical protein IJF54_06440 [Clostridia bacterium]|nr:hypothetical protein [Clostridia bacterium]
MKKTVYKIIAAVLAAVMVISMSSCNNVATKQFNCDLLWEKGKISARPTNAYYDEEGQFIVVVGVTNSTNHAKVVHTLEVVSIKDIKGRDIIEGSEFVLDEPVVLEQGKATYIQCDFEKEKVLFSSDLKQLSSEITVKFYGCVKNGPQPAESDTEGYTMTIPEAVFSDSGAIEGKIAIRNNYKTDKTPSNISFSIKTNSGEVITKENVQISNSVTIKAGGTLTIAFTLVPNNIKDSFAESRAFDTLTPVFTIE